MFERFRAERAARRAARNGDAPTLVQLLSDHDPKIRSNTANACMLVAPGSAPPSLIEALLRAASDPEGEVRGQALLALGSTRAEEARDVFIRALADEDWGVRMFAATAFGWMPDPRGSRPLEGLLADEQPFVRQFAVFALGEIGDPAVVPSIEALLEHERDTEVGRRRPSRSSDAPAERAAREARGRSRHAAGGRSRPLGTLATRPGGRTGTLERRG